MYSKNSLLSILALIFVPSSSGEKDFCDETNVLIDEGSFHQNKLNWLGVLKMELHNGETSFTATSGIVLIRVNYALGNADDVGRVAKTLLRAKSRGFRSKAKAMFFTKSDEPWYSNVTDYYTQPDYHAGDALAIIELDASDLRAYPVRPICFPKELHAAPNKMLFAAAILERELEKVIYKMKYLNESNCKDFYGKNKVSEEGNAANYTCMYAPSSTRQCDWGNGMVLISNTSGWFHLIGVGIKGPGCAAPSRFLLIQPHLPWIRSVVDKPAEELEEHEDIPIHMFLQYSSARRFLVPEEDTRYNLQYFQVDRRKAEYGSRSYSIVPKYKLNSTCDSKWIANREDYELNFNKEAIGSSGITSYKLTTNDLLNLRNPCVIVKVTPKFPAKVTLEFTEILEKEEKTTGNITRTGKAFYWDLEQMYGTTKIPELTAKNQKNPDTLPNYVLYITLYYTGFVNVEFEMYTKPPNPKD